jgi:hypothetical protein
VSSCGIIFHLFLDDCQSYTRRCKGSRLLSYYYWKIRDGKGAVELTFLVAFGHDFSIQTRTTSSPEILHLFCLKSRRLQERHDDVKLQRKSSQSPVYYRRMRTQQASSRARLPRRTWLRLPYTHQTYLRHPSPDIKLLPSVCS